MNSAEKQQIRWVLAIVWLVTGIVSLGIYPQQDSLALLTRVGLYGSVAVITLYAEAGLDIVIGVLTLIKPNKILWQLQAVVIIAYTLVITVCLPEFWLHPFGPLLKNLPIFMLLRLLHQHEETL